MDTWRRSLQTESRTTRINRTDGSKIVIIIIIIIPAGNSESMNMYTASDTASLPGLQTGVGWVEEVGVEHCSVGRRSDRLAVQLHLLLRISELQGAGTLVGRRLFPV